MHCRWIVTTLAVLLLIGSGPLQAQRRDSLPTVIATAFRQTYPDAKILNVSRERRDGKDVYEVESQDGPMRRDLIYGLDGQTLEIEEIISPDSLPDIVRAAVVRDLPGARVTGVERVTRGDVILYEVQVRHNGRTQFVTYDPQGERRE